jgi:hypothetical protein
MQKLQSLFLQRRPDISRKFMLLLVAIAVVIALFPARWLWTAGSVYAFTWKFRSRDKNAVERTVDNLYDEIPPVNPVNARSKSNKDKEKEKE